jgi:hypothetical protein
MFWADKAGSFSLLYCHTAFGHVWNEIQCIAIEGVAPKSVDCSENNFCDSAVVHFVWRSDTCEAKEEGTGVYIWAVVAQNFKYLVRVLAISSDVYVHRYLRH